MTDKPEVLKEFYQSFPPQIEERCGHILGLPPKSHQTSTSEQLKVLIEKIVPESNKHEVIPELRKTILLGDKKARFRPRKGLLKKKKFGRKRTNDGYHRGKTRLTSWEKRNSGLLTVNKRNKSFAMFVPIHRLWRQYAQELLGIRHLLENSKTKDDQDKRTENVQNHLKKMEYYGCFLKVTQSTCPSYVGLQGIVIGETKNTFTLITEENSVKIVPKVHSQFCFTLDRVGFSILGSHLHQRPMDRAKQNIKKHNLWL